MTVIQFRRGPAATWTAADPVLAAGEPGFEADTHLFKIGDGVTRWSALAYESSLGGGGGVAGVSTFAGRSGAVVPATGDYTASMVGADPTGAAATAQAASDPSGTAATAVAGIPRDAAAATASLRTLGTGAQQAAAGADVRITGAEQTANKGIPGGYAQLDSTGKLLTSQLPGLSITDTFVVGSQAAMLATGAHQGDVAVRQDISQTFILAGADPTILANWQTLLFPSSPVTSVDGATGAVILPSDAAAGTAALRSLGTGAQQAAAGNDARFAGSAAGTAAAALAATDATVTNSRAPTGAAGGDLAGTYPNPTLAVIGAAGSAPADASHTAIVGVDTKGRVVALGSQAVVIPSTAVTGLGTAATQPASAFDAAGAASAAQTAAQAAASVQAAAVALTFGV